MAEQPKLAEKSYKKLRTVTGWTILCMVLLRIAIGWHFFYEGIWKLRQDDWRATSYLVMAQGPMREYFRWLVDDVDGLRALTPEGAKDRMDTRRQVLVRHYNITDKAMLDRIKDFTEARKSPAEKDPAFESAVAGVSARLTDAVYADYAADAAARAAATTQPAEPAFAEQDVKAQIERALAARVEGFKSRPSEEAPAPDDLEVEVAAFLENRDYQPRLALLQAGFVNDVRNAKLGYVESIFEDDDFNRQLEDYRTMLEEVADCEGKLGTTGYNAERLLDMYKRKAAAKTAILARAERPMNELDGFVLGQLQRAYAEAAAAGKPEADTAFQAQLAKALPKEKSPTFWIDWANMIALTVVGAGLMLGLFTRLSALGGIGLLMLYYWCMPSLPWLPEAGPLEGHYLFVNKNIIEALALLMIATSGIGRWGGLDGFLFRKRRLSAG